MTFGLVSAPTALAKASKDPDGTGLAYVAPSGERARQVYVDPATGDVVEREDLRRGVEVAPGEFRIVDEAEFDAAAARVESVEVLEFVKERALPDVTRRVRETHYLQPQGGMPARPLGLLAAAMEAERVAAVAKFSVGSRERLGLLRWRVSWFELHTLLFADAVLDPDDEARSVAGVEVSPRELRLARQFVRQNTGGGASLDSARDESALRRRELVERVLAGDSGEPAGAGGGDLMGLLEASVRGAS